MVTAITTARRSCESESFGASAVRCVPDTFRGRDQNCPHFFTVLLYPSKSCHDSNVKILTFLAACVAVAVPAFAVDCPKNQPKTEAALKQLEQDWAGALSRHDADTVACMVADEFEEADVDGSLHTRAQMLEHIPHRKPGSNHLTELRSHVDGNFGFVRGLNEVLDAAGKVVAKVRFTDVFTYRDGRWQAILAHESLLGEASR
jgi:ketosteroid isomerase-like protein